jgi:MSHA biogenesis protein MshG
MELYQYKGRNKHGEVMQGTVEAANPEGVVSWMMASGISPISVQLKIDLLKDQPSWVRVAQGHRKLNQTDLLMLTRQLGTLLKAGIPILQAVTGLKVGSHQPEMTKLLSSLHASLDKGAELSAGMAKHPEFFNDYYINMVRVGESAGKLEEVFQRLYAQLDFDRRMRQKIKAVLRYPSFVLSAIIGATMIVMVYVIPSFSGIYGSMNVELPLATQILMGTSNFIQRNSIAIAVLSALVFLAVRFYISTEEGRYQWDRLKLRIPIVGRILVKATTARFCRSFGMAMNSGVPIVTAMGLVARVVDNAYYHERIMGIRDAISHGDSLLRGFLASGIFSPTEIQMISVGEETGDIETMVQQLAILYQDEVEYEASQLSESLEPILLIFMAALVLLLLLGIFLPMWNMTQMTRL